MSEPSVQKNRKFHSAVEVLRDKASALPAQMAYRITRFREAMDEIIDYGRLDLSARCIAGRLRAECPEIAGERVLICIGFGLEYITAFFGCLYAGAIAVPAFPPRQNRMGQRLRAIAADAEPKVVLTTSQLLETARAQLDVAPSPGLEWIAVDALQIGTADSWVEPRASPDDVAYLQYTSGSTAEPKGVMVTHRNILHNSRLLNELFRTTSESHAVSWLPLHHDMGLIGAIFQPLLGGYAATMMAPASFLQKPYRWLEAIGRYRCTISAAPNFAYDLCTRSIPPAQRDTLDLSSWKDACCGGEPVRPETLERFTDHFRPCGFRKGALFPCYGLAEATLIVAGGIPGDPARVGCFQTSSLKEHRAVPRAGEPAEGRALVSCGSALPEIDLKIVDPETRLPVAAGSVGEIWTASASVASGYWKRPAETEATFKARLRHDGDSVFLRTGDMGFIWEDGLYITGRRKELIIVHGANFYPQDIENTVASCHDALGAGAGAVFAIDDGREERLVVVHELGRNASTPGADAIFAKIRQAVWDEHELKLHAVALVKKFGVPRTSSGKIQRFVCRDNFLSQTLPVLAEWKAPAEAAPVSETGSRRNGVLTAAAIQNWLIVRTSELLNLKPFEVDTRVPFGQYGFDSIKAVSLSAELEDWIGLSLPSTLLWDYPNIDSLSNYLVSRAREVKERRLSASPNGAGPGQQYQ